MGYTGLVAEELQEESSIEELALKRAPYVQKLVDDFLEFYRKKYAIEISTIPDVTESISYLYFLLCYKHVKPVIVDKTNKFKMASIMELLIVQKQVLIHPDENSNRKLNALFGMTAALALINCMITDANQEFFCCTNNADINREVDKLLDDHQLWLETKPLNDLPVFINAQFYELVELLHTAPLQLHAY